MPSEGAGTEIVLGFQLTRDELRFGEPVNTFGG